ncbi:MAG TPA: AraC family transcriptional regulator [Planctomycetota bacterium]|nr:AraC family transcriptional regulator [Planctomycetota bacterium]
MAIEQHKDEPCGSSAYPIIFSTAYYRQMDRKYFIPPHTRTGYQWYCVISGDVDQVIDGVPVRLGAEESVLIPPGVVRSPRCVGKAPGYIVAAFQNVGLDLTPLHRRKMACPAELVPDLHALVAELRRPGTPHESELIIVLLMRLLIGLRRSLGGKTARSETLNPGANREIVARVENFMLSHLQYTLSRRDFASAVNLSSSHLARVFRQTTGKTLVDRLTELRMQQARMLLRDSTLPITHIALEVGYNSFSHFTRLFKRKTGVSPSEFRAQAVVQR